jgi:hypothetical protein
MTFCFFLFVKKKLAEEPKYSNEKNTLLHKTEWIQIAFEKSLCT